MKAFVQNPQKVLGVGAFVMLCVALFVAPRVSQAADVQPGTAEQGKILFEKRCTGCHSLDQDKEGPRLRGVFGRKAGKIGSFTYSDSLKDVQFSWDAALLDKWLTDTESVVPNNDMTFHVPNPQERADIIRFLESLSGK
jgi:cytochrome c